MKKIIVIIFFAIVFIIPKKIFAYSYVVMDSDSGRILESMKMKEKQLIASTTKIMTAIVALEYSNIKQKVVAGEEISSMYGSMLYLKKGEIFTLEDLIYGLLLQSGNDASMVIAKNVYGYDTFIKLMNLKANEIGMYDTTFENPHGLNDSTKNYSTAYDLALLMRYSMNNKIFKKINSTKKYKVKTNLNTHIWYNKNKLLNTYKYSTGGKIGYTKASSHVFVSSATKDNKNLIIATIKDTNRFTNHERLYEKNFFKYKKFQILDKYTFTINDDKSNGYFYIKNDFYSLLTELEKRNLHIEVLINNSSFTQNNHYGYVKVFLNDKVIHSQNLYLYKRKNIKSLLFFKH